MKKKREIQSCIGVMKCENCQTLYGHHDRTCPHCGSDKATYWGMMGSNLSMSQMRKTLIMLGKVS